MRLGRSAAEALEMAYTLGHTSFEKDQYQKPINKVVGASTRGRITRNEDGAIVIPPFAMCAATESRRGRTGTTNTICNGIEAGSLLSAAEHNRPGLHVLWLRAAYHPMDRSCAKVFFGDWLFQQWKERRAKAPKPKLLFLIGTLISCAIDSISYQMRNGVSLINPPEKCRELSDAYRGFWLPCTKLMNWNRDIKPELDALFVICSDIDKKAMEPVVQRFKELKHGNKKRLEFVA